MGVSKILNNMNVLYIEDDEVTLIIVRQMLKSMVGKLHVAKNGEEGMKLFEKHKPEIVITDLRMPKIDGIELIKNIREKDAVCGIIITTEINDLNRILESIDIGIDKYMVKPMEKNVLEKALHTITKKVIKRTTEGKEIGLLVNMDKEWKIQVADNIKAKFSSFLKKKTKKGPTTIHTLIKGRNVIISIKGALTQFEKSLLINSSNSGIVSYNRELLYKECAREIEMLVSESIDYNSTLESIKIKPLNDEEEFIFSFDIVEKVTTRNLS